MRSPPLSVVLPFEAAEANNMKNGTSSSFFTENAAKATSLFGPSNFLQQN
jgi:hypothetical protein